MNEHPVARWASEHLSKPIAIRPITQNRAVMWAAYGALLMIPGAFILIGLVVLILTPDKTADYMRPIGCGLVLLIPIALIIYLASYVRRGFALSLDVNGAYGQSGLMPWTELQYVDHVSKFIDRGDYISDRKVEDNDLKLVFNGGSVTIPPLIRERQRIWRLIHSIPCEHKVDGVSRS